MLSPDDSIARRPRTPDPWGVGQTTHITRCRDLGVDTPEHGDSNEKAQNHRTHLAGRRDPGLRRRRRLPLRRLDRALSDPRWPGRNHRRAWRELRSAAWPSHLRWLVGLLAEG